MSDILKIKVRGWLTLNSNEEPDLKSLIKVILTKLNYHLSYENKYPILGFLTNILVNLSIKPKQGETTKRTKRGAERVTQYRWTFSVNTMMRIKFETNIETIIRTRETFLTPGGHNLDWNITSEIISGDKLQGEYFFISEQEEKLIREMLWESFPFIMKKKKGSKIVPSGPERRALSLLKPDESRSYDSLLDEQERGSYIEHRNDKEGKERVEEEGGRTKGKKKGKKQRGKEEKEDTGDKREKGDHYNWGGKTYLAD